MDKRDLAVTMDSRLWRTGQHLELKRAMRTVSRTGLLSVLLVAVTGVMSGLFHRRDRKVRELTLRSGAGHQR